ncbi:MAG TPA: hypothetical protein VFS15_20450, partial [Kofleriaceae bacterium]|nr:hypothetical protein [Kofleriaceae bacterium]
MPLNGAVRGVAGDGTTLYAAVESAGSAGEPARSTTIEARRGGAIAWRTALPGGGGPLAVTSKLAFASVVASDGLGAGAVRGEPAGAVVALDATTGAKRWT